MRIGVDGRAFAQRRTGIRRYIEELCNALDPIMPEAEFYLYSPAEIDYEPPSERWRVRLDLRPPLPFRVNFDENRRFIYSNSFVWLKGRLGRLCTEDELDVFWANTTFTPRLPARIRTITTVYDLTFLHAPETTRALARWQYGLFFRRDVSRADAVATISNGSSDRLQAYMGRSADAIVPTAAGAHFRRTSREAVEAVRRAHRLDDRYLLLVGTLEPRKNHPAVMEAFLELKRAGQLRDHKLVVAGGRGWKDSRIRELLAAGEGEILPLGYVPDEHLPALYTAADVYIFPGFYDGSGLPILEARACGTSVVVSDVPELREAGGDAAIYVPATKDGMAAGIVEALQRREGGEPDVGIPTWEASAEILAALMRDVALTRTS